MKRTTYDLAESIVNRMDRLQKTIFELQEISDKKSYTISVGIDNTSGSGSSGDANKEVRLGEGEIATEVFIQGFFEYYLGLLNLELDELKKQFDELA